MKPDTEQVQSQLPDHEARLPWKAVAIRVFVVATLIFILGACGAVLAQQAEKTGELFIGFWVVLGVLFAHMICIPTTTHRALQNAHVSNARHAAVVVAAVNFFGVPTLVIASLLTSEVAILIGIPSAVSLLVYPILTAALAVLAFRLTSEARTWVKRTLLATTMTILVCPITIVIVVTSH